MNKIVCGTRKFSEADFAKLAHVQESDLENQRHIVTRTGDAMWYRLLDTPDGKYVAAKVVDVDGIQQTHFFHIRYINMWFKLSPEVAA